MDRRNFVKISAYGLLLPVGTMGGGFVSDSRQYSEKIKKQSLAAFKRFETVWDFNDFWKRGNTFDACLTFADAIQSKWPGDVEVRSLQTKVDEMLEKNYTYFKSFDPGVLWADDFGWWGLMALNARKHLLRSGNKALADKYLKLGTDLCWEQGKTHAYDFAETAKPIPHGYRNGDAKGQNKGVKNTVTNVLYFLLSTRIYRLALKETLNDNEKYLEMAYRQWVWFDSWFKLDQYEYLKKISETAALVQERPTAFFEDSDYKDTAHPTWEKGWTWSGDQGMLLAALTDMLAIKNDLAVWILKNQIETDFKVDRFEKTLTTYIHLITKGIKTALIGDADSIIREAPFRATFGLEFGNDYLAGRGIMMRYIGKLSKQTGGISFTNNIKATAAAIWQTRATGPNQFQPEFTNAGHDKLYVTQFRKLAGVADDVYKWDIAAMDEKQKFGVCQSVGLDAFGALINLM